MAAATLVFIAAGAVLMLEILAVRLLAPYVGLTLETTTAIIGAALAGIASGAAIGGYFADRTNTRRLVVAMLIGGGLLALLIVPIVRWLGPGARGAGELAALGITFITLVPVAAVLSAVSPAVAHLQLHDLRASGTVVGTLGLGDRGCADRHVRHRLHPHSIDAGQQCRADRRQHPFPSQPARKTKSPPP